MDQKEAVVTLRDGRNDFAFAGESVGPEATERHRAERRHGYLFAKQFADGKDVVDVASGEGDGSFVLGQVARSVVGVDPDPEVIERAQRLYGAPSRRFAVGDVRDIPLKEHRADLVVSFKSIEPIAAALKAVTEFRRVLRPEGVLILSTPAVAIDTAKSDVVPDPVRESAREELLDLLRDRFKNVRILEQRFLHGSIIGARSGAAAAPTLFIAESDTELSESAGPVGELRFVAVASDADLPELGWSVLDDSRNFSRLTAELRTAAHLLASRDARIAELERDLATARRIDALAKIQIEHLRQRLDAKNP